MTAWLFLAPFAFLGWRQVRQGDDNGWWWIVAGVLILGMGAVGTSACQTDWDGRANRVICD